MCEHVKVSERMFMSLCMTVYDRVSMCILASVCKLVNVSMWAPRIPLWMHSYIQACTYIYTTEQQPPPGTSWAKRKAQSKSSPQLFRHQTLIPVLMTYRGGRCE